MSMKPILFSNNNKPKSPKSPTSPTVRQLLQAERVSNYLSNKIESPNLGKDLQQQEEHFDFQPIKKLSVLAKVKEKARKWRQNLGRKKPGQDSDPSPSWGVAYEDYEKDEDPRCLETPSKMYALRRSATSYKEGMRERSNSGLSITEKHVLSCSVDRGYSEQCERLTHNKESLSPSKRLPSFRNEMRGLMPIQMISSEPKIEEYRNPSPEIKITPFEEPEKEEPPSYEKANAFDSQETVEDTKLTPLASQISIESLEDEKELNPSSLKLVVEEMEKAPTPTPEEGAFEELKQEIDSPTQRKNLAEAVIKKLTPVCAFVEEETSEDQGLSLPKPLRVVTTRREDHVSAVGERDYEENGISGDRKLDKGVSVKDYIKNKLEPGEDERALSQVISEAISPRRTPGDKGVMEKVKEAVTLLLLAEQQQQDREHEEKQKQQQKQEHQQQQQQQRRPASLSTRHHPSSLSQIPVSTYPYEDEMNVEEESQGRILQAN